MRGLIIFLFSVIFSSSSIGAQSPDDSRDIYHDLMLDGLPIVGSLPGQDLTDGSQLFTLSEEMHEYLDRVATGKLPVEKLNSVIADLKKSGFELSYDLNNTTSAAEAFSDRRGNCVSFAAMIVTMARALGVEARLNRAPTPGRAQTAISKSGQGYVQNIRHINAVIISDGKPYVVEQGFRIFVGKYLTQLKDSEAYAVYLNNLAMEAMARNELAQALHYSREAIRWDKEASYLWNSLGTLYRRSGSLQLAEMSFSYALTLNGEDEMARSNLRRLRKKQQKLENSASDTAKSAEIIRSPEMS